MLDNRPAPGRFALWLSAAFAMPLLMAATPFTPALPVLSSRPSAAADTLPPGITRLRNDAIAYRPARLPPGSHPLVVILHGNHGQPGDLLQAFKPHADNRGLILLAPKSSDRTWDLVADAARFRGGRPKHGEKPSFGPDVQRIDAALAEIFQKAAIDPGRVVLAGFSDGATYALSLGLANPKLFPGVLALTPGFMVAPKEADVGQRLFIAHGRTDRVIPIKGSRAGLAPALMAAGMKLRFQEFNGAHEVDRKAVEDGLAFALGDREP